MKRRDFLAIVSSAGLGVGLREWLLSRSEVYITPAELEEGCLRIFPDRQGIGHPVKVYLDLPRAGDLKQAPPLVVVREGEESWFEIIELVERVDLPDGGSRWVTSWTPPPSSRPTEFEEAAELMSFRAALFGADGASVAMTSNALEVVCARRGWGC